MENGQVYYVRTDHIRCPAGYCLQYPRGGHPVLATDSIGAIAWQATYLPFGGVHTSSGDLMNLRFPGQWFQSESGLHQNWMRDYDPTAGRYLQADPLGLIDGASVYGYAAQNPMRYTDPTGEFILVGYVAAAVLGSGIGVVTGYGYDMTLGDGCYTWQEAATDAALGGWARAGHGVTDQGL